MPELTLSDASILSVIQSLLADELKALRPHADLDSEGWNATTRIRRGGGQPPSDDAAPSLGADSMELLALATAVTTYFRLHESRLEDYLLRYKTLGEWAELVRASRAEGARDLAFSTSGSTGVPRVCHHAWVDLVDEASFFARHLKAVLSDRVGRVIALAPCHHIYGFLFGVLLPERLGVPVHRGHSALAMVQGRRLEEGDVIVGFPFLWQQLSRQGLAFPDRVLGLTSTGPCDSEIITRLRAQGLSAMVEIYGASETAGVGVRTAPEAPFTLLPRWQHDGEDRLRDIRRERVFPLEDELQWHGEGHFLPLGRKDKAVQVGGVNVYPARIARLLERHPEVAEARVRLMAEGGRLKAFVVPASPSQGDEALTRRLTDWCERHLSTPEIPRAITVGERLPGNALGKPSDWGA